MELHTRNSEAHGRDGHLIMCHWNLLQNLMSDHLWVKRKLELIHPSHLLPNVSHRERREFLVATEIRLSWQIFTKEKKRAHFSTKKKKEKIQASGEEAVPHEKSKDSSLEENYFETYLNHHHPLKKKNLPPLVCLLFWTHPSRSQSHCVLPAILQAHTPRRIMNLIWAMAFTEKKKKALHSNTPHKRSSDKNKWLLNLDFKLRISLQIKMTGEHHGPRALTIISWAPNDFSLYYGWSNNCVCSSP